MPAPKRSAYITGFFTPATKKLSGGKKPLPDMDDDDDDDDDDENIDPHHSLLPSSSSSRHSIRPRLPVTATAKPLKSSLPKTASAKPLRPSLPSSLNVLPSPKPSLPSPSNAFSLPDTTNDAENVSYVTTDLAGDVADYTGDDLLALSAAELAALESAVEEPSDDAEVELALQDEDLDVPATELQKKGAFYDALEIPSSAEQMPADVFLQLLQGDPDIKQQVIAFARTCMSLDRDAAPVPTNEFLKDLKPKTWESHCPASDQLWDEWVSECKSLGVPTETLDIASKISGPCRANLNIVWHYPTYNVGRIPFGFTADPKSHCLAFQNRKMGPNPRVCTNDIIPFRARYSAAGVDWPSLLPNSAQVLEKSVDLTMRLLSKSRVVILVGKPVRNIVCEQLEKDPSKEIHKLFVPCPYNILSEDPYILVVRDKGTKEIQSLVFISQHTQSFFYHSDQRMGLYHDFVWNAACAIANIPIVGRDVFYRASTPTPNKTMKIGGQVKRGQLALSIAQRGLEKSQGIVLPDAVALAMFKPTIDKNPEQWAQNLANRGSRTIIQMVMQMFSKKAIAAQRADGFPNLANNRTENSEKGRAAQKDQKLARIEAVLDAFQSRQLLAKANGSLTEKERGAVESLEALRGCLETGEITEKCRKWRDTHVIYYSKKKPYGLRFEGDRAGPDAPSSTLYNDRDHPCVSLINLFYSKDKKRLDEEWAQQQNTN